MWLAAAMARAGRYSPSKHNFDDKKQSGPRVQSQSIISPPSFASYGRQPLSIYDLEDSIDHSPRRSHHVRQIPAHTRHPLLPPPKPTRTYTFADPMAFTEDQGPDTTSDTFRT